MKEFFANKDNIWCIAVTVIFGTIFAIASLSFDGAVLLDTLVTTLVGVVIGVMAKEYRRTEPNGNKIKAYAIGTVMAELIALGLYSLV